MRAQIYPPLFAALLVYSIGGTGLSLYLGRNLVGLNFAQEAQEANYRCPPPPPGGPAPPSSHTHRYARTCIHPFLPPALPSADP